MFVYELFEHKQERGEQDVEALVHSDCDGDMFENEKIGHIIRMLHVAFKQRFIVCGTAEGLDEVTMMHGWIMVYLYGCRGTEVYQKTIETQFNISRSTVTAIVQLMEKKGYISREAVEGDARLKKIVLTRQGTEIAVKTKAMLDRLDRDLMENISNEERETFCEVSQKLIRNMERCT